MKPEVRDEFESNLANLFSYLKKELKLKQSPKVVLASDDKNASKLLGKTAYYDPDTKTVHLFIVDRHPKDILRSFAHEVIHHWQHENEQLQKSSQKEGQGESDPQYAQHDPWLRQMEKQAYLLGNILFRDWEDQKKAKDRKSGKKLAECVSKKKSLNEGPEDMLGYSWTDSECLGPVIFFRYKGRVRYCFGNRGSGMIEFDGGKEDFRKYTLDTHGPILDSIEDKLGVIINRSDYSMAIQCRVWEIKGKIYIGSWSSLEQMKSFGARLLIHEMKNFVKIQLIKSLDNVLVNPLQHYYEDKEDADADYDVKKDGVMYTFDELEESLTGKVKKTDLEKQKSLRMLHLLDPKIKANIMKQMGIQGKVGPVPDFQRRAAKGIDEKTMEIGTEYPPKHSGPEYKDG